MGSFLLCVLQPCVPALLVPVVRGTNGNKKRPPRQFCREDVCRRDTTSLRFRLTVKASAGTSVCHRKDKVAVFAKSVIPLRCHGRTRRLLPPLVRSQDAARRMYSSHRLLFASHHPAYLWKRSMGLLVSGHGIYVVYHTTENVICIDV